MKKNNKKKLLIIFLFVFAIVGVVGYGAYSYYYTTGNMETNSDTIYISSFNPTTYNGMFLGDGGDGSTVAELDCPDQYAGGNDTVYCTASTTVHNDGDTTFTLNVSNISVNDEMSNQSGGTVGYTIGTPTTSWSQSTVDPSESGDLTITVPITFDNNTSNSAQSSEAEYVSEPVAGGQLDLTVSYSITATQVHD